MIKQRNERSEKITLGAADFSRLSALSQADGSPCGPLKLLVANLYQAQQIHLPMTQAEFDRIFAPTVKVFSQNPESGVISNITENATVDCNFLLTGVGLYVTVPGQGFGMPGIMVNVPAESGTDTPCNSGCAGAGQDNAVLAHGYPAWSLVENFLAAYRVQMFLCRRFNVFDMAARDMGYVTTVGEFEGAGNMVGSAMPWIRDTNDVLLAKGCDKQFIPQNAVVGASGSECLGAPTASMLWGAPHTFNVLQKYYRMPQPILYTNGMQLDFRFVQEEGDECFRAGMQRDAVLDCTAEATKPSSSFGSDLACGLGSAGVVTVPSGCMSFGLVLAGYDVSPGCCIDYYNALQDGSALMQAYQALPPGTGIAGVLAANPGLRNRLGGMPNIEKFLAGS